MIDLIGAIAYTALYAVLIGALVGFSPAARSAKLAAFAAAALWGAIIVAIAARGGFAPGATGPIPPPAVALTVLLALLLTSWFLLPRFRNALFSVPLPALIAVNAARIGGVFFLILAADGRLSGPFAPVAAWGDILVGVLAIPLAAMAALRADAHRIWVGIWNGLGALDLLVAASLAMLSSPGTPFFVFTAGPGVLPIHFLPWVMVPTLLAPLYLLIHFTIAVKLRSLQPTSDRVPASR